MKFSFLLIVVVIFNSLLCEARVFDFKFENWASYLRATGASSQVGQTAFSSSSGSYDFVNSVNKNYGIEFGFLTNYNVASLRLGLEGIRSQSIRGMSVKNSSDQELYALDSVVLGLGAKVGIDFYLSKSTQSRWYLSLSGGWSSVTLDNSYTLTSQGQSDLGLVSFAEQGKGESILGDISLGYESLFSDTATLALELGYRLLKVDKFKHGKESATFLGSVSEGDVVLNDGGSSRTIDLGGVYIGLTFRFYIDSI